MTYILFDVYRILSITLSQQIHSKAVTKWVLFDYMKKSTYALLNPTPHELFSCTLNTWEGVKIIPPGLFLNQKMLEK